MKIITILFVLVSLIFFIYIKTRYNLSDVNNPILLSEYKDDLFHYNPSVIYFRFYLKYSNSNITEINIKNINLLLFTPGLFCFINTQILKSI